MNYLILYCTCVPTGINTGVSTSLCTKLTTPTLAFVVGQLAITLYINGICFLKFSVPFCAVSAIFRTNFLKILINFSLFRKTLLIFLLHQIKLNDFITINVYTCINCHRDTFIHCLANVKYVDTTNNKKLKQSMKLKLETIWCMYWVNVYAHL